MHVRGVGLEIRKCEDGCTKVSEKEDMSLNERKSVC